MGAGGLSAVRARVVRAAAGAGRIPDEVTLVAISKTAGAEDVLEAYAAGQRDFGENRAGELAVKAARLPADIRWHFVGSLQSRKARTVAPIATMVHSIDRESLIRAWAKTGSTARLLLQLNLAEEPQKHGAAREEAPRLLELAAGLGLEITGLMVMPPFSEEAEASRPWFRALRRARDELSPDWPALTELSMGMTNDFEVAIEEGATLIRVGRAIFDT